MKHWVPLAVGGVVLCAYGLFYALEALQPEGASAFSLVNTIGLVVVFVGVIAAGLVIRRASPPG